MAALPPGATVVDIGCGAGMDLMLAASAVGPGGHAIGIDMTEPMAERARASARVFVLESVGFQSVRMTEYFDPFGGTSKERVARKYGVRGVNVHAVKS